MSQNPYESPTAPQASAVGVVSGSREDLKKVATYQKGVIVCIGLYLLLVICQLIIPPYVRIILAAFGLVLIITGAVFTFLLSMKIYGTGMGIVLGILTLIPCFGLFVLLIINGKATSVLRQNGIRVGFFGAADVM